MFLHDFGHTLAPMKTIIPEGGDQIEPQDNETLRYCIRSADNRGFIFINNYQDHVDMQDLSGVQFQLNLPNETLQVPANQKMTVPKHAAAILPFNFLLDSYELKYATTQLMCKMENEGETHYFFFAHDKMGSQYAFKDEAGLEVQSASGKVTREDRLIIVDDVPGMNSRITLKGKDGKVVHITTLTREQALHSSKQKVNGKDYLFITDADIYVDHEIINLLQRHHELELAVYPALNGELKVIEHENMKLEKVESGSLFETYKVSLDRSTSKLKPSEFPLTK